ncbi:hypothetical protein SPRG_11445 [Saprolegnia parasitica CBS 223.65]|uniref:Helicase ATP-binding domain-containing protein n=1 Tax=Saprolegnia parasitica (strain CBS 223.65) TaxID=695850 RepID=A0A067BZ10_SAPPC|nr:hypothetical protein SPRG_11445 [Saprolegnia parasitica CBS 223.65]KDO23523.1 hypothetical protein SPRG_11445 [Saprolegnia parasitica CBS 223.65]|eukprot:XP_012205836.1 hypothetical protein SPRG_11445 [Saprolegnia parasitica CBS 223.65]
MADDDACTCGFLPCVCVTEEEAKQAEKLATLRSILMTTTAPCDLCLMLPCICDGDLYEEADVPLHPNPPVVRARPLDDYGRVELDEQLWVADEIADVLKPHQVDGVRFMTTHLAASRGCILADYMGLGKTLQLITTLQSYLADGLAAGETRTALVLCPTVCIMNWVLEFRKWLKETTLAHCPLFYMETSSHKASPACRIELLEKWHATGGVLILGYEMYRMLLNPTKSSDSIVLEATTVMKEGVVEIHDRHQLAMDKALRKLSTLLCNPGPSLVALDEGHRIKDPSSILCTCLERIATPNRIVLTGYPLQNSLAEYWCMVNFALPGFLGTYDVFRATYEKPILDGDDAKATELTSLLSTVVLRRGQALLNAHLPQKFEWIVHCHLSPLQHELYCAFLDRDHATKQQWDLFTAYTTLLQLVNHPDVVRTRLFLSADENENEHDATDELADWQPVLSAKPKPVKKRKRLVRDPATTVWAARLDADAYEPGVAANSGKLSVFLALLHNSRAVGDKIAVFSQSVSTLREIARFIDALDAMNDGATKKKHRPNRRPRKRAPSWRLLEGSVSSSKRMDYIETFSNPSSGVDVFLVSTRAGAEGINLHAANRVVLFDVSWNPSHDHQSMCRSHRIGQSKDVHVYRLVSHDTIEEKIYNQQVKKVDLSANVVDATAISALKPSDTSSFFTPPSPPCDASAAAHAPSGDVVLDACLDSAGTWIAKYFRALHITDDAAA